MGRRQCPRCKLLSPMTATKCECGFELGSVHFTEAAVRSIDLSWGETFYLCLKVGLCAIPAIWIAWGAWHIPSFLFDVGPAIKTGAEVQRMEDEVRKQRRENEKALRENPLG